MNLSRRVRRLESANKGQIITHFPEECLCFPVDEQPEFMWGAEVEEAAKVLCPLHGLRFETVVRRSIYQAQRFYLEKFEYGWQQRSAQYQKAMRVSLDLALWPAKEVPLPWPQEPQELILRDGTRVQSGGSAVQGFQIDSRIKKSALVSASDR